MHRVLAFVVAAAALLTSSSASAQAQRTFVASYGNDTNTATFCGFANPCRSFAAAQTATQAGGEIVALDAAGYGSIDITKSLSIVANPGVYAGISASSGAAVTVSANGAKVRLRGLNINGTGATVGVVMVVPGTLAVEDCVITNFLVAGIAVNAAARVTIVDTIVRGNYDGIVLDGGARGDLVGVKALENARVGVYADAGSPGVTTTMAVSSSVASGNEWGFISRALAEPSTTHMTVSGSSADHNTRGFSAIANGIGSAILSVASSKATMNVSGFYTVAPGTIQTAGDNLVTGNGTNLHGNVVGIGTN